MQRRRFLKNSLLVSTGVLFVPDILTANSAPLFHPSGGGEAGTLKHFWSVCAGAGRANEGLRAGWLEQLKLVKEHCGFQYLRFHGLFHDDMFVYKEVNSNPVYNWQYINDLFDRMLDIGVKPFVELGFMPKAMASGERTQFWWKGNVSPPKDYNKWAALVTEFTKNCINRYGLDEVKTWYFEVWNEPDLRAFWDATKSEYFQLYKVSANALKAIDKDLRVGGPATSNFVPDERFDGEVEDKTKHKTLTAPDLNALEWRAVWMKDFLNYCAKEKLPVDFVSTHPYPTDYAIDPETKKGGGRTRKVDATREDLQWLKKTVAESAYPMAQIHLTEWSSSPSARDATHDSLQAAAYIIKVNLDCIGLTHSLSYWTFTDVFEEGGGGDKIFHGGFGMINFQGIVKPAFHAYRMLNQLGDEVLQQEEGMIVTRHSKTKKITALIYHYPPEMKEAVGGNVTEVLNIGSPKKFNLTLAGLKAQTGFVTETLDKNNGFAYTAWEKMGRPEPPGREQTKQLKLAAMATKKEQVKANTKGELNWQSTLQPWTCVLINEV